MKNNIQLLLTFTVPGTNVKDTWILTIRDERVTLELRNPLFTLQWLSRFETVKNCHELNILPFTESERSVFYKVHDITKILLPDPVAVKKIPTRKVHHRILVQCIKSGLTVKQAAVKAGLEYEAARAYLKRSRDLQGVKKSVLVS